MKKRPQFLRLKGGIHGGTNKHTCSMVISYERRLLKVCEDMDSINLDLVKYKWRVLVNTGVPSIKILMFESCHHSKLQGFSVPNLTGANAIQIDNTYRNGLAFKGIFVPSCIEV
jgi:hypothetical protein